MSDCLWWKSNGSASALGLSRCPCGKLRIQTGHAVLQDMGIDVLVTRDAGGKLRAFRNSCLDRGSREMHGCGKAAHFQCAHHGCKYALDGRWMSVPGANGLGESMEGLCISCRFRSWFQAAWCGCTWGRIRHNLMTMWQGSQESFSPTSWSRWNPSRSGYSRFQ